jgi:hypothetical protein
MDAVLITGSHGTPGLVKSINKLKPDINPKNQSWADEIQEDGR